MNDGGNGEPLLSVILVTDNVERITRMIQSISAQTIAKQIELVLILTSPLSAVQRNSIASGLHSVKAIDLDSIVPLSIARAKGVRAASAPSVFIAETHAYPDPELAEKLSVKLAEEWSVVVPGFRNANPDSGLSCAGFLSDYGAWAQNLEGGEVDRVPSYNVAFRRSVLLELGDRLEHALTFGDELYVTFQERGHRFYFYPAAGIQHVNIDRFKSFVRERYLAGALIGGYRSERWKWSRRIVYALGSPLIPIVILSRVRAGVREARRSQVLPRGTTSGLALGAIVKAMGEARAYLFGTPKSAEKTMTGYEIRKLAFNAGEEE